MLINSAYAAAGAVTDTTTEAAVTTAPAASDGMAFSQTIMFTVVLIVLFYFLLIRPQQRRFKDHSDMLGKLNLNDRIVTQGGMIGTIAGIPSDKEVLVDFGNNIKMTVLRSSVMGKYESPEEKAVNKKHKK